MQALCLMQTVCMLSFSVSLSCDCVVFHYASPCA
jgi:hypothetical protein